MQTTEQALFDTLPLQTKPEKSGFNLQANAVDQWFDTLPMANTQEVTKSIYKALHETNAYQASYKKRLYFLETIHEAVIALASNMKKLNLNRQLPLNNKHQRIAVLLYKLHNEISTGYKLVLQDLINCHVIFLCPSKHKLMTLVIERIIRHNSLSLMTGYQLYNAPHKGLWSDIHHLFLLAHKEKLQHKKVSDPSLQYVKETTIKNAYMQILLVATADPYRIAQHHTFSIFQQLENWSALADLHQYIDSDAQSGLLIDLSQDTHPSFVVLQDISNKDFAWTIDTSKLDYDHLIEHFNDSEILSTEINVDLLKQLSLAWGIAPSRQYNRRPAKSELKVAIGLNNVHYVLNGYAMPDWIQTDELENNNDDDKDNELMLSEISLSNNHFSSISIDSTDKINDIWGEVFTIQTLSEDEEATESINSSAQSQQTSTDPHAPREWGIVNESIGGYCLLWEHGDAINAKVGEIIAISYEQEKKEGYWFVGTIRWMKCIGHDNIQIGVQIMAPNAMAVSIAKYSDMQEGMKSRAIMLPAIPVLKQPKTLITTALGYESQDQVILNEYRLVNANITSIRNKVILKDTLEISSHFSRFKYSLAEELYDSSQKQAANGQAKQDMLSLDGDIDFDSIWDDL